MRDEKNAIHLDVCKMFHATPVLIAKGKVGEYDPGAMRVRQTGKQLKEPLSVAQCQTGSQHQVVLQDCAS